MSPGRDSGGRREARSWRDLELVDHWTTFLADPDLYLRHLGGGD